MDDWRHRIERHLTQAWLLRGPTAWLLLPLAWFYAALGRVHRLAYRVRWLHSRQVNAKVVVVGNVIVGGAGKTPTVMAVANEFRRVGHTVGIVSRGYGRTVRAVLEVHTDSAAGDVGDEPLLLRRSLDLPVFVGQDRVAAAQALLEHYPATTVVVCDDGLQHLRLYRDLEIYVFDNRGTGNGWPLPAGPLRSPWPVAWVHQVGQSQERALVVHTGSRPAFAGHVGTRRLQPYGEDRAGTRYALRDLAHSTRPCIALAGIAQPQAFFDLLTQAGIQPRQCIALPDHFDFSDWQPSWTDECVVLCTEKDAVKLWNRWPSAVAIPLVQTMTPAFFEVLLATIPPPTPAVAPV